MSQNTPFSVILALKYLGGAAITFVMGMICLIVSDHLKSKRRHTAAELCNIVSFTLAAITVGMVAFVIRGFALYLFA